VSIKSGELQSRDREMAALTLGLHRRDRSNIAPRTVFSGDLRDTVANRATGWFDLDSRAGAPRQVARVLNIGVHAMQGEVPHDPNWRS
jgi:hypothetical protein